MKIDGTLFVAPVERSDGGGFVVGAPKPLFQGSYYALQSGRTYDVAPDGKRFLMIKETPATNVPVQLLVVQNWVEELKRQVPAR